MADTLVAYQELLAASVVVFILIIVGQNIVKNWHTAGCSFKILWLFQYPAGMLFPPAKSEVEGKSFLEVSDVGVKRMHEATGVHASGR